MDFRKDTSLGELVLGDIDKSQSIYLNINSPVINSVRMEIFLAKFKNPSEVFLDKASGINISQVNVSY